MALNTFHIYYSTKQLPKEWDTFVKHDVFLQSPYLEALQHYAPNNIQVYFIGVFLKNELVGVALVQMVNLYLKDMFRKTEVSCAKEHLQNIISKVLKGNILVIGNLMQTGQHALFFDNRKISLPEYTEAIYKAVNTLKSNIASKQKKRIHAILLKDFFSKDRIFNQPEFFNTYGFHQVIVQPNMILRKRANWHTIENYRADLKKKYRDRYKRARKKLGQITVREMELETIKDNSEKLHNLYLNVSNNANFNSFMLPKNHFFHLKQKLNTQFKVFGYYMDEYLIGFSTLILNGKQLETYFLGYDVKYQKSHQLYLNMLYDMLNFGIENQFSEIVYARTAMAIKSSVGAKPYEMVMYIKHTNRVLNTILKPIFKLMNPKQDWEKRHPFAQ